MIRFRTPGWFGHLRSRYVWLGGVVLAWLRTLARMSSNGHRSPASTGVAGSNSYCPNSSMVGRFNYSSDRPYVDVLGQLLVILCEVLPLPVTRRVWPLTPEACERRCATKLQQVKIFKTAFKWSLQPKTTIFDNLQRIWLVKRYKMCETYHLRGGWIRLSHGEEFIIVFLCFYNSLGAINVRNILYDPYQCHPNY